MNADDFWTHVDKTDGCWEWTASRTSAGYGNLRYRGRNAYAHRVSYELSRGPIGAGLVIDHLCRNHGCVRPDHLEPVTTAENNRRGAVPYGPIRTECKHGHDVSDPANVYTAPKGDRRCRVCASEENARRTAVRQANGDRRKVPRTHCKYGHEMTEENRRSRGHGRFVCRLCDNERARAYRREAARR